MHQQSLKFLMQNFNEVTHTTHVDDTKHQLTYNISNNRNVLVGNNCNTICISISPNTIHDTTLIPVPTTQYHTYTSTNYTIPQLYSTNHTIPHLNQCKPHDSTLIQVPTKRYHTYTSTNYMIPHLHLYQYQLHD